MTQTEIKHFETRLEKAGFEKKWCNDASGYSFVRIFGEGVISLEAAVEPDRGLMWIWAQDEMLAREPVRSIPDVQKLLQDYLDDVDNLHRDFHQFIDRLNN